MDISAVGSARLTRGLLVAAAAVVVVYVVVPIPPGLRTVVMIVGALGCAALILTVTWRTEVARSATWSWLVCGLLLHLGGSVWWVLVTDPDRTRGTAAQIDLVFLTGYLCIAVGLARLIHRRDRARDIPALLDAALLTGCVATVAVQLRLVPPLSVLPTEPERFSSLGYVLADLVLLTAGSALLRGAGRRQPALVLLTSAVLLDVLADGAMDGVLVHAGWHWSTPQPIEGLWLASYLIFTAALAHPSAALLDRRIQADQVRVSVRGVVTLGLVAMTVPVSALIAQAIWGNVGVTALAAGSALSLVIVMARLVLLARNLQTERDRRRRESRHDALTGLANRRTLDRSLERAVTWAAAAPGRQLSVVMIDLDHFKRYNDRFGHAAGDDLLRECSRAWAAVVGAQLAREVTSPGPPALLARYGGEEFTLIAPRVASARVLAALGAMGRAMPAGVTFSAGLAVWHRGGGTTALMGAADTALYEAKRAGRNRVHVAGAGLPV